MDSERSQLRYTGPILAFIGLLMAVGFTLAFPAVEGLGAKVRLPVFHGAMTWVNLALFVVLAVLAIVYLATRRDALYGWVEATRFVAVPLWVIGSALGFMAALNTWDFTGSKSSPLAVAAADPRLNAQFWIMLAGLAVLALGFLVDERRWLAATDVAFVAFAWVVLMRAILGPGRALHPDSPVLNSDELFIKLMFFGIVVGMALAAAGIVMVVRRARAGSHEASAAALEAPATP
jgi:hypothetical protein